ncbi:hypothetical protein [Bradyrhizobium septentrionale]|uniref:Uncharacterized protein n=1 Tax=Bradyrhizobium septentrionale TaxID=1404411 RepID=A0ABZ2NTU8_9BRAD
MSPLRHFIVSLLAATCGGCGLYLPELQEPYQNRQEEKLDENAIVLRIKCELHKGVQDTLYKYRSSRDYLGKSVEWLNGWGAAVTLKVTADEKSSINPGFSIPAFPHAERLSVAGGLQASADATRAETIGMTYRFDDLLAEGWIDQCDRAGPVIITSDLKIGQFIENKAFLAAVPGTVPVRQKVFDAFSYQATFVITYGGGITPTYKFVDVTANPDAPFLNGSRTRTHDITITIGEATGKRTYANRLSPRAEAQNYVETLSQAIASANRSRLAR